jgi:hypothetical protein
VSLHHQPVEVAVEYFQVQVVQEVLVVVKVAVLAVLAVPITPLVVLVVVGQTLVRTGLFLGRAVVVGVLRVVMWVHLPAVLVGLEEKPLT